MRARHVSCRSRATERGSLFRQERIFSRDASGALHSCQQRRPSHLTGCGRVVVALDEPLRQWRAKIEVRIWFELDGRQHQIPTEQDRRGSIMDFHWPNAGGQIMLKFGREIPSSWRRQSRLTGTVRVLIPKPNR